MANTASKIIAGTLSGYLEESRLKPQQAAEFFCVSRSTLTNWLGGRPCPLHTLREKILPRMGVSTLAEAELRFDKQAQGVDCFPDFWTESEGVFLSLFHGAKDLCETRIMMPGYPNANAHYRPALNSTMFSRLSDSSDHLKVTRVEQINSLDRAVDLVLNMQTFDPLRYEIWLMPFSRHIPFVNFSIVDDRAVIAGGFHGSKPPKGYPFFVYKGRELVRFYRKLWEEILQSSELLTFNDDFLKILLGYVREIPDGRCESLTTAQFEKRLNQRKKLMAEYPPRY